MLQRMIEMQIVGNELWRLFVFFVVVLLSLVIGKLARISLTRVAARSRDTGREGLGVLLEALSRPVVLLAFSVGLWLCFHTDTLSLPGAIQPIVGTAVRLVNAVAFGWVAYSLVDLVDFLLLGLAGRTASKVDDMLVPLVGRSIRIMVMVLVALHVAKALSDKPITELLLGLGVGGLAIALAAQDTIKNFFGSLVIVADKPFEIGDRITIDGYDGPVESVGFRSTKIRTLTGHLVTIPNSEIVSKSVRNIGKRPYIRRLANITITYDTPPEKVKRAVQIVREILVDHEGMNADFPPRVYFNDFNDWALNILVLYWYHPPDYWKYMDFTERVNGEILKRFNEEGIEFAFPSQTVYMANDDRRQLAVRMLEEQV